MIKVTVRQLFPKAAEAIDGHRSLIQFLQSYRPLTPRQVARDKILARVSLVMGTAAAITFVVGLTVLVFR